MSAELNNECVRLSRYLVGRSPDPLIVRYYVTWHETRTLELPPLDQLLLRVSRRGAFGLRLADAYAGRFARRSIVRTKLVLMLALLEARAPHHEALDRVDGGGVFVVLIMSAWRGALALVFLGLSLFLIGPRHWMLRSPRSGATSS